MAKLVDVEGIGPVNAKKLKNAGVGSTDSLLSMGGTAAGRKDLAAKAGVSDKLLLDDLSMGNTCYFFTRFTTESTKRWTMFRVALRARFWM